MQALASDLLGLEISTGQICALERETAKALEPVVAEAREYVRGRSANVDETGWKQGKAKAWLWVAVTKAVTVFAIALSRSRGSFDDLIGPSYRWVVTSDRYSAYGGRPLESEAGVLGAPPAGLPGDDRAGRRGEGDRGRPAGVGRGAC